MKKLIIFGGSFDPIHKGHIAIANKAFKKLKADKLFFVPCNQHPDAKKLSASNQQRLDMINMVIKDYKDYEISDFELKMDQPSYTIYTIRYFYEKYPNCKLYFLIGYDQLLHFDKWHDYLEILQKCQLICHTRKVNQRIKKKNFTFNFIKIGIKNIHSSSTDLKINPQKKYLDTNVLNFINENGLYAKERLSKVLSEYRLKHCITVAEIAVKLATVHQLESLIKKAYVAGIYHDYAKEFDKELQIKIAKKMGIKEFKTWKILHGYVAAYYMNKKFLMDDYQVLTAVKSHTTPYDFSALSKIVYLADKLAFRDDDGANDLRKKWYEIALKDINLCFDLITKYYEKFYENYQEKD